MPCPAMDISSVNSDTTIWHVLAEKTEGLALGLPRWEAGMILSWLHHGCGRRGLLEGVGYKSARKRGVETEG